MIYLFVNPLANNKKGNNSINFLQNFFSDEEISVNDITKTDKISDFISNLSENDIVIISGGDGTISKFANEICGLTFKSKIFYFPSGSGNDFYNDVKDCNFIKDKLVPLNNLFKFLPIVYVNNIKRYFINGVGFGIDGYCCEEGDRIRVTSNKKVNYTKIAIKGFLFKFKPRNAVVTVDGKRMNFSDVWLAPSMIGRFYGGGMKIAPNQNRFNDEKTVTCVIAHHISLLKIIKVFPKIFKGNHVKYNKNVALFTGHEINVKFDKPCSLQIDGETIKNVTSYRVVYR